jgi:hypothetical protein
MPYKLQDCWSSINTHTINTEIAVLAMTTKPNFEKDIRFSPKRGVSSDPLLTVFTLMTNSKIARFYTGGHGCASEMAEVVRPSFLAWSIWE